MSLLGSKVSFNLKLQELLFSTPNFTLSSGVNVSSAALEYLDTRALEVVLIKLLEATNSVRLLGRSNWGLNCVITRILRWEWELPIG
jgi:hypothetical protein